MYKDLLGPQVVVHSIPSFPLLRSLSTLCYFRIVWHGLPPDQATEVPHLPLIRNKQIEAAKQYASILFLAPELIGLLMDLNVPQSGFRHVSEFMTGRDGPPITPTHPFM